MLLLATVARACQCTGGDLQTLSPPFDAQDVPTNAHVLVREFDDWVGYVDPERMEWLVAGVVTTLPVHAEFFGEGGVRGMHLWTDEVFPSTALVVLHDFVTNDNAAPFTTSDLVDDEPPEWSGKYTGKAYALPEAAGADRADFMLQFHFEGFSDDGALPPLVWLEPRGDGEAMLGPPDVIATGTNECCGAGSGNQC